MTKKKMAAVKKLGGCIEEILTAVRLIASYANEEIEAEKFRKLAAVVRDVTHDQEFWLALTIGVFKFVIFLYYVYSIYIASIYLEKGYGNPCNDYKTYETGTLLTIFISFMTGMLMIFGLTPNIQAIIKARVVGKAIFDVIDRVPEIRDHEGCSNNFEVKKEITFKDVSFRYPTQPAHVRNVLERMSFKIKAGETTAIVGPSGSGKSTIVQMIERFYSPLSGDIFFDDVNIKDITLKALRENIGYVSQEPVLILGTIRDNLLFGNKDATPEMIEDSLKKANATFVHDMDGGIDAYIGSSAVLNLSGGQKQRIAIARALVKNPKLMILDEATSALDPRSEKEVQGAIDKIAYESSINGGKLTIVMIAHRLQTIMSAQNLLYLESKNTMLAAAKGTPEYDEIIKRL